MDSVGYVYTHVTIGREGVINLRRSGTWDVRAGRRRGGNNVKTVLIHEILKKLQNKWT